MNMFSPYTGCHEFRSVLSDCWSLNKGSLWWYSILGDNEGIISHLLRIYPITSGSILLTIKIVALKQEILIPSKQWNELNGGNSFIVLVYVLSPTHILCTKYIYFFHIGYIQRPSSIKLHIPRHHVEKYSYL